MRIAVITDVHANSPALDAVVDDAKRAGAEVYWLLGDLVAMGPDPAGTAQRLRALDADVMIMGNTDRYVLRDELPIDHSHVADASPKLVYDLVETAASMAWTKGVLAASGDLAWLATGVARQRTLLPDGTAVLAVHASADLDQGPGINPSIEDAELAALFTGTDEPFVLGGHTHYTTDRTVGGRRFVNPGSVSNPHGPDKRARYALLDADADGHVVDLRAVDYDVDQTIAMIESSGIPGRTWLTDEYWR